MAFTYGGTPNNPYMSAATDAITSKVNNNLQRTMLPSIGRGAVANGLYGGSRQGIAEGLATGEAATGLAGALANMYSTGYGQDQQYDLGLRQVDASQQNAQTAAQASMFGNQLNYNLGSDRLNLDIYNANQNWINQGQQNQMSAANMMMGWNQQAVNNATNVQNAPMNYWQQFSNGAAQMGGQGGTSTTPQYSNPWLGAIGGWQLGQSMFGG